MRKDLPLNVVDERQQDDFTLDEYSKRQVNGVFHEAVDADGEKILTWAQRPGLSEFVDLGETANVDGLFWWSRQDTLVAVCNGKVFFITESGTVNEKTGTATMVAGVMPTFVDIDGNNLFIASSGQIGKYPSGAANDGVYIADVDAPTNVTHIATLSKKLIAQPANTDVFYWSNTNSPDVWQGEFATAETYTDLTKFLHVANARILIGGTDAIEQWRDDSTTYIRELQGFVQSGVGAAYSFAHTKGMSFWLNSDREVLSLTGRSASVVSGPYAKLLKSLDNIESSRGFVIHLSGKNYFILNSPNDGITLVYDIQLDRWCEWGTFNYSTGEYDDFIASSYVDAKDWGRTYIGDNAGKVHELSFNYTSDNGKKIRTSLRTGQLSQGASDIRKMCRSITVECSDSLRDADNTGDIILRYRDDGKTEWKAQRDLFTTSSDTTNKVQTIHRLGSYHLRQYELIFDGYSSLSLLKATEDFDHGR